MNSIEKAIALNAIASDEFAGEQFMDLVVARMPEEMLFTVEECDVGIEKLVNQNLQLLGITPVGNVFGNLDFGAIRINKVQSPFLDLPLQYEKWFMEHRAIHDENIGRIALSRHTQVQTCYGSVVSARDIAIWKIPDGGEARASAILRTRMDETLSHPTIMALGNKLLEKSVKWN